MSTALPPPPPEAERGQIARLIEDAGDAIFVYGPDGRLLDVNRHAGLALGFSREELLRLSINDLEITGGAAAWLAQTPQLQIGAVESLSGRFRRRDGTTFPIEARVTLLERHGSRLVLALVRDVTVRLQTEMRLRQARDDAENANASKSEFLSRMSHELRTPLNSILGFSNLLYGQMESAPHRDCAGYILGAGQRLLHFVDEVLEIAQLESGARPLCIESVRVSEVLAASVEAVRASAEVDTHVNIDLRAAEAESHLVAADRQCLQQVFYHLLSNAVKFSPKGSTVTVSHQLNSDSQLRICICDQGPGIASEHLPRLFEPFERAGSGNSAQTGPGLGLTLSKHLVTAIGGSIGVQSDPGAGSVFWVQVPAIPPANAGEPNAVANGAATDDRPGVLYIDDDESNLILMQYVVAAGGQTRLLTALRGAEGLELAHTERPDLILLDLRLPDLTGEEVLARLRADAVTRDIPVVAVTGDVQAERRSRLTAAGVRGYVTKPFDIPQMLALLGAVEKQPPQLPAAA